MIKARHIKSKMLRLQQKLFEYDFELIYRPGRTIADVDALSRAVQQEGLSEPGSDCVLVVTRSKNWMEADGEGLIESNAPEKGRNWHAMMS